MNHTPYRRIAALPQKAQSASVNGLDANASKINLSMHKAGSKTFTLDERFLWAPTTKI
jgi:hypothetical protein